MLVDFHFGPSFLAGLFKKLNLTSVIPVVDGSELSLRFVDPRGIVTFVVCLAGIGLLSAYKICNLAFVKLALSRFRCTLGGSNYA